MREATARELHEKILENQCEATEGQKTPSFSMKQSLIVVQECIDSFGKTSKALDSAHLLQNAVDLIDSCNLNFEQCKIGSSSKSLAQARKGLKFTYSAK